MPQYAAETSVAPERSRAEIERTLSRYGAGAFGYAWEGQRAMIEFKMNNRRIRILLLMPTLRAFYQTPTGRLRTEAGARDACEQAIRQRWRALALYVKAKCEAIEAGIVSFEDAWLAHTVLPSGETVAEWLEPQIEDAYRHHQMPPLLPAPASSEGSAE